MLVGVSIEQQWKQQKIEKRLNNESMEKMLKSEEVMC